MRITPTEKQSRNCDKCGKRKVNAKFYHLKPHPAIIKLLDNFEIQIVCRACAVIEEFGSNYRQNRRYKEWEDAEQK